MIDVNFYQHPHFNAASQLEEEYVPVWTPWLVAIYGLVVALGTALTLWGAQG